MSNDRRSSPVLPVLAFGCFGIATTFFVLRALEVPFSWHYAAAGAYLTAITLFLHLWQEPLLLSDPKGFVNRFMLGLVLKMLLSLMLIVLILFTMPAERALPLALTFAVMYLAFLGFSTVRSMTRKSPRP